MFDFTLPYMVKRDEQVLEALATYITTCLSLKIPVLQPNVADVQAMKEERARKGTHPELLVRVCGYSAWFGQLSADMQDEIISRALA